MLKKPTPETKMHDESLGVDAPQMDAKTSATEKEGIIEGKEGAEDQVAQEHKTEQHPEITAKYFDEQKVKEMAAKREREEIIEQYNYLANQLSHSKNHNKWLENERWRLFGANQKLQNKLHRYEAEHNQIRNLLDERTAELRGAQVFLSKADSVSGGEAIKMVESLNSEILQTAALMADGLGQKVKTRSKVEVREAAERLHSTLGMPLITFLDRSPDATDEDDSLLVQVAFQFCLLNLCFETIESWCHWDEHYAAFLSNIYSRIQEADDQTVSGRWRAMTRAQLRCLPGHQGVDEKVTHIARCLCDIQIVSGWLESSPTLPTLPEGMYARIVTILNMSLELQAVLSEGITSGDIRVLIVRDQEFDPTIMEDAYAGSFQHKGRQSTSDRVICTTDLGLRKDVKGSEGIVILKPKVILRSAMDDILEKTSSNDS